MVYKVSKGGVRSGNTLRGLHSLKTRRYMSQACLIGRSNLSDVHVENLLHDSLDDNEVKDTLRNTDVVLSLNKKGRWRVPSAVSHMIRAGYFSESNTMVSLLERHKLKKTANCVGFECSKELGGMGLGFSNQNQIFSKESQKKYFSYSLDYVDQAESRRQVKKRMAEDLKTYAKGQKLNKKCTKFRTVNVFTVQGRKASRLSNTSPVYNLEIFYPCPQSCSLTHNPKYTDVIMTQNNEGEMEIKCNTKTPKTSRKKQRKRFTKSDLAAFTSEMADYDEDVEDMWRQVYEDTCSKKIRKSTKTTNSLKKGDEDTSEETVRQLEGCNSLYDSILTSLVSEAELVNSHLNSSYASAYQKKNRTQNQRRVTRKNKDTSHIKYIQDAFLTQQSKSLNNLPKISHSHPVLSSFPIVLPVDEVTSGNLREKFGSTYSEADCQPRRFCLNITGAVRSRLSVSGRLISSMHSTYLVFISSGLRECGLETFRVTVNCAGCLEPQHVSYSIPYGKTTLDKIISTIIENLNDLKEAGYQKFSNESLKCDQKSFLPIQEKTLCKKNIQVCAFFTSDELSRLSVKGKLHEKTTATKIILHNLVQPLTEGNVDQFCEICYEVIGCTQSDITEATQLNACGHIFCNTCWQAHLRTQFREGAVHMICPGYQCDISLGPSTLLSLLHVTEVAQILQRACEDEVEVCPTAKWCPSSNCGRVIRLEKEAVEQRTCDLQLTLAAGKGLDITCACGEELCFTCLSPAHWPASCEQAHEYLSKRKKSKPLQNTVDSENKVSQAVAILSQGSEILEVEGRLCPKCHRFINKNGGCHHMSCKCGHQFCWTCLHPFNDFNYNHISCSPNPKTLKALTRIVKIRHMAQLNHTDSDQETQTETEAKRKKTAKNRYHKASMLLKAVNQRKEAERDKRRHAPITSLVGKICKAMSTDMQFQEEVLLRLGFPKATMTNWGKHGSVTANDVMMRQTLVDTLTRYLSVTQQSLMAFHRVTEYTFVLLQDLPACTEKRRAFRVASDLMACCTFSRAVLQAGENQDPRSALKRLFEIETWSNRAIDTLLAVEYRLKHSVE